ncbi:hypothetical protein KDA23_00860 [Candidatus Saccharibacteria bacterium]|nr:hypothetical protein [Candidatus Saccharibacteria bacterium]
MSIKQKRKARLLSQRLLSALLVFVAVFSLLGAHAFAAPTTAPLSKLITCYTQWDGKNYRGPSPGSFVTKYKSAKCDVSNGANCTLNAPAARNGVYSIDCEMTAAMAKARCQAGGGADSFCNKLQESWYTNCSSDFKKGGARFVKCMKDVKAAEQQRQDTSGTGDPAVNGSVVCTADKCPLITKYINPIIAVLSSLVLIVAIIAIVIGAIQVSASGGDPQMSASGKKHIRNAIVGLLAYFFLLAFLQFIIPGGLV